MNRDQNAIPSLPVENDYQGYRAYAKTIGNLVYLTLVKEVFDTTTGQTGWRYFENVYSVHVAEDRYLDLWNNRQTHDYTHIPPKGFFVDSPLRAEGGYALLGAADDNFREYNFNGIDQYATLDVGAALNPRTEFTVCVRVRTNDQYGSILTRGYNTRNSSNQQFTLGVDNHRVGANVGGRWGRSNFKITDNKRYLLSVVNRLINNRWRFTIYVDGLPVYGRDGGTRVRNDNKLLLGCTRADSTRGRVQDFYRGRLDDLLIYSRALSETELSELVNSNIYRSPLKLNSATDLTHMLNADKDLFTFPVLNNCKDGAPAGGYINGDLNESIVNILS